MDYFNFFYKLSMIFSNKKRLKIFIVIGLIALFIFACSHGVFASTSQDDLTLMNYQIYLQENMISYLRLMYQQKLPGFDQSAFTLLCGRLRDFQVYVTIPEGDANSQFWVYFYVKSSSNNPNIFTTEGTWSIGLNSGTQIPCMLGQVTPYAYASIVAIGGNRTTPYITNTNQSFYMPAPMFELRSTYINEFLEDMGLYSKFESTYTTHDAELQNVTQSGFASVNSSIQSQTNQMTNSINDASTSITNSVDNLNNTITDTTTDDSQVELAQDTNQDLTNGFFTSLYNSIEDAFTDTSYKYVNFPIPFTNKNITWSSSYVLNNIKRNEKFSVLVSLAESVWWFGLGYFVLLDIYKKINAIKSGDLTNIENENITTNLL